MAIKNLRDPDLFGSKDKFQKINIVRRGESIDLNELEKQGDAFKCINGCHLCCEPINLTKEFWNKHKDKAQLLYELWEVDGLILPLRKDDDHCVFLTTMNGCAVYDDRPIVCRIYGLDSGFECPYLKPDGTVRRRHERRRRESEHLKALKDTMYMRVRKDSRDCTLLWRKGSGN